MDQPAFSPITFDAVEYTLITLVKHYPELYDPKDESFHDLDKKGASWAEIAKQLEKEQRWCISTWNTLHDCYNARKRMFKIGSVIAKRWPYDDAMSFLAETHDVPRATDLGMIQANLAECELTSGSSKSRNGEGEVEDNASPCQPRLHSMFDETQYHSLDELNEKCTGTQFGFESITERPSQSLPLSMKRKNSLASDACNANKRINNQQTTSSLGKVQGSGKNQHPLLSFGYNLPHMRSGHVQGSTRTQKADPPQLSQPLGSSTATAVTTNQKLHELSSQEGEEHVNSNGAMVNGTRSGLNKTKNEYEDCPHYHFCMSLAARFRNMDEGKALFTQMKIMELLLKTEFPLEYNRRMNTN